MCFKNTNQSIIDSNLLIYVKIVVFYSEIHVYSELVSLQKEAILCICRKNLLGF
jgi:hypothetical protein